VSLLGKNTRVPERYAPELLDPIPRQPARKELDFGPGLPFRGEDVWHAWELAWLQQGQPRAAVARIVLPCESPNIIESKSLKLYLASLNHTSFASSTELQALLQTDLGATAGAAVSVEILPLDSAALQPSQLSGECIDGLAIESPAATSSPSPDLLACRAGAVQQVLYSHLLRSLCPVTAQPDWASVIVTCEGVELLPASLLAYIVSFRNHQEFHEQCVERMFRDIQKACAPAQLSVQALYTRRGGLDINPFRATDTALAPRLRTLRQ
jgi:7-cyano-7-deazaguanine reductase